MEIFKLFGSIFIDSDEAQDSISKTEKGAESLGGKLTSMIGTAAKWGAAIGAAGSAAVGGMMALVNKTASAADEIDKMSLRTGLSRTQLQELKFVAGQTGVSFSTVQSAVTRMTQSMGKADEEGKAMAIAFGRLGVVTHDAAGNMRSADDVFNETITSLANMDDKMARNALAMEIFGKGAVDLIPMLDAGADGIAELSQRAHELGAVMTDEAIAANVAYLDAMDEMKTAIGGVFAAIGTSLIPVIMIFVDLIRNNMPTIQAVMEAVFGVIGILVEGFITGVRWIVDTVTGWVRDNQESLGNIQEKFLAFFGIVGELFQAFIEFVSGIWTRWGDDILEVVDIIWSTVQDVFGGAFESIQGLLKVFTGIFSGDWEQMWEGVKEVFSGAWTAMEGIAKGAANLIIKAMNGLINGLNKISFSVPSWVPLIGGKSWGFSLANIPLLAQGGDIRESGAAIVGEAGPELIQLQKGARVTPLPTGGPINLTILMDGRVIARGTAPHLAEEIVLRTGVRK